jgi:Predicted transcriptional regulator
VLRNSYWITDYAQIEALAHPARHEIVDRLSALGPIGARGLAEAIGRKVTTIYHHLQLLERVGLIEVASIETADSGRPFAIYQNAGAANETHSRAQRQDAQKAASKMGQGRRHRGRATICQGAR